MAKKAGTAEEKRLYPRGTLRTQVIFEDEKGEGFVYFYSTDVSEGGLFFEHDVPLRVGTKVFLSFRLPNQELIRATGEIVRQAGLKAVDAKIEGMGLRFIDIAEEQRQIIRDFLHSQTIVG